MAIEARLTQASRLYPTTTKRRQLGLTDISQQVDHMDLTYDRTTLEAALSQMEVAAFNFAHRAINDAKVRASYISQTAKMSQEFRTLVKSGAMTAAEAASQAQLIRNEIMEAHRLISSDLGKAIAEKKKPQGKTLTELMDTLSKKLFKESFERLTPEQQNKVYLEIIESAGRPNHKVNQSVKIQSKLGRSLVVVSLGIAIYNTSTAEDKAMTAAREGTILGAGVAGAAMTGKLAGMSWMCGPGAPICVGISIFIGGAVAAMGADFAFGWFFE